MSLMRTLRTIRHLRARQMVGQLLHRARGLWEDLASLQRLAVPAFPGCVWRIAPPLPAPLNHTNSADEIEAGRFTFLNQTVRIGFPPDWNGGGMGKLWTYNLHYFDYLWGLDFPAARSLVMHWIEAHPPRRGHIGWEPYPTSVRLINWCAVLFWRFQQLILQDHEFCRLLWQSIYRQAEWLSRHIENHLLGNHLLENAAALLMVGECFDGPDAKRWFDRGLALLRRELPEQILADGGHFERSPMYHCRVVYLLLMLRNLNRPLLGALIDEPLTRAMNALRHMLHPDGQIALLNDSAFGVYPTPTEPAGPGSFALSQTGYYGARTADGSYIICDAGPIGPDYLPGHAHGDMLSFELSIRGKRVITDSGVFDYEIGEMRDYCRSTRAHNTVEINGQDQCEFWAAFRVGARGHIRNVTHKLHDDGFALSASHDGYCRLQSRSIHDRAFRWWNSPVGLGILDMVKGARAADVVSRLHLAPEVDATRVAADRVILSFAGDQIPVQFIGNGELSIEHSWYCPQFGVRQKRLCLVYRVPAESPMMFETSIGSVP